MEELIVELYFELLQAGPVYGDIEQWDPTLDALVLEETIRNYICGDSGGEKNVDNRQNRFPADVSRIRR